MNIKKRLLPAALIVIATFGCILLSRPTRVLFFAALAVASAFELSGVLKQAEIPVSKTHLIVYILLHTILCDRDSSIVENFLPGDCHTISAEALHQFPVAVQGKSKTA